MPLDDRSRRHLTESIARLPKEATFPVLVEGEILHFPISRRHALVGTIHTWGDGKRYRKDADGWSLVPEPTHAGPTASETPKTHMVFDRATGISHSYHPDELSASKEALALNTYHKDRAFGVKAIHTQEPHREPEQKAAPAQPTIQHQQSGDGAPKAPAPNVSSKADTSYGKWDAMNLVKQTEFEHGLKPGDEAHIRWTAGSFGHYGARAKVTKVNDGSLRAELMHDVVGYGLHNHEKKVLYPKGHVISVPKRTNMKPRFGMRFGPPATKWSAINGVFPVGNDTPKAQEGPTQHKMPDANAHPAVQTAAGADQASPKVTHATYGGEPVEIHQGKRPEGHDDFHHTHGVYRSDPSTHIVNLPSQAAAEGYVRRLHRAGAAKHHVVAYHPPTEAELAAKKAKDSERMRELSTAIPDRPTHPDDHHIDSPEKLPVTIPPKPEHVSDEMHKAVSEFAHKVRNDQYLNLKGQGYLNKVHVPGHSVSVKYGRTYANVDVGGSGKFMVALKKPEGRMSGREPGDISSIQAYGVPNHRYHLGNVLAKTRYADPNQPKPHG